MKRNLSDAPLQIVFALFDANQDGNLAATELVTVSNVLGWLISTRLHGCRCMATDCTHNMCGFSEHGVKLFVPDNLQYKPQKQTSTWWMIWVGSGFCVAASGLARAVYQTKKYKKKIAWTHTYAYFQLPLNPLKQNPSVTPPSCLASHNVYVSPDKTLLPSYS